MNRKEKIVGGGEFRLTITFSIFGNSTDALTDISIYSDNELLATIPYGTIQYVLICKPNKTYVLNGLSDEDPVLRGYGVIKWITNNVDIVSSTDHHEYGYYESIQIKVTANNATLDLEYSYGKN